MSRKSILTDYVLSERRQRRAESEGFVIPVTVDDLAANGLLEEDHPQVCWERSVETLTARKDDIAGLAVASDERIEAYLLYVERGGRRTEILSLRTFIEDGGARLKQLLSRLRAGGTRTFRFPKVHPAEISTGAPGDARFPPRRRASSSTQGRRGPRREYGMTGSRLRCDGRKIGGFPSRANNK